MYKVLFYREGMNGYHYLVDSYKTLTLFGANLLIKLVRRFVPLCESAQAVIHPM